MGTTCSLNTDEEFQLREGNYLEIYMNGIWTPICGLHFGKNNLSSSAAGAIYCRKLDLEFSNTGMNTLLVGLRDLPFETNTIRVGHCLSLDQCNLDKCNWLNCTGESEDDLGDDKYGIKCGSTTKSIEIKMQCNQGNFGQKAFFIKNRYQSSTKFKA